MSPADSAPPRTLRITFLSWRDPGHPDGGGSEVYVEQVARRLAKRGHTVTVRGASYPAGADREVIHGVTHRRTGGRLSVYVHGLAFLLTQAGREQDVVIDVINGLPFWAPLVRRHGVIALVHHVHREQWSIIYPDWRGRLGWFIESRVVPRVYRAVPFVTVSQHSRADLVRLGVSSERVSVVRNGLQHEAPAPTVDRHSEPRICVLSRLVPHKRIEHALQALARLRTELPGLELDVIGDGWWRDELLAEARRLGVEHDVTFHGHVSDTERDRLLGRAWVMLLPSVKEGWGIAVTEAARLGTPTVGYRASGGLAESVEDEVTGILADDLDGLVGATRRILTDDDLRAKMSAAATRRAQTFDWDDTADQFEAAIMRQL